jgi:hypothetical protein
LHKINPFGSQISFASFPTFRGLLGRALHGNGYYEDSQLHVISATYMKLQPHAIWFDYGFDLMAANGVTIVASTVALRLCC